jgi:hypothetical protein
MRQATSAQHQHVEPSGQVFIGGAIGVLLGGRTQAEL